MATKATTPSKSLARDLVSLVLAIGIATAVNVITIGVLYDAIVNGHEAGLSENATQVLTTAFGGIIGVLGSYVGYQQGAAERASREPPDDELADEPHADPTLGPG